jgi:hypothetical protein
MAGKHERWSKNRSGGVFSALQGFLLLTAL